MILHLEHGGQLRRVDTRAFFELGLPLDFAGPQARAFGGPLASAQTFEQGGFRGDTSRGGPCNVRQLQLSPHLNGTHTESAAHLSSKGPALDACSWPSLLPATLLQVEPVAAAESSDTLGPASLPGDRVIDSRMLEAALEHADPAWRQALLLRVMPLEHEAFRDWQDPCDTPYFSPAALRLLREEGVEHLLCELPSVDRLDDGGLLQAHRAWWNLSDTNNPDVPGEGRRRSITELALLPPELKQGPGLLELLPPRFRSDAAPSAPRFYPLLDEEPAT